VGKPGQIQRFKSGVGRLIAQFQGIPILPVFLSGPERVLPKNCFIPLPFWNQIVVGPPQICKGKHHDVTHHLQGVLEGLGNLPHLRRHGKTRLLRKPAYTVALMGIDGCGKSSISREVAIEMSTQGRTYLVSDELECFEKAESNPLQPFGLDAVRRMLSKHAKRATSLQTYKLPKLTELLMRDYLIKEVDRWYDASIVVQDGSPLLNMAGWAALYHGPESLDSMLIDGIAVLAGRSPQFHDLNSIYSHFSEINILSRLGLNRLKIPDALVLLDISPECACDRIQQRGKLRQPHENIDKLTRLRQAYLRVERLISQHWNVRSLVLNGDANIKDISKNALKFFNQHFETHKNGKL
jgi:thymidylate kinase